MKFSPGFIIIPIIAFLIYWIPIRQSGVIVPYIDIDKNYNLSYNEGICYLFVWKNFDIIATDNFFYSPSNYDSLLNVHLSKINNLIKSN